MSATAASAPNGMRDLPPRGGEPVWADLADICRGDPGVWYPLGRQRRSMAWHIQQGRYAAFRPAGHFEAKQRNTVEDTAELFVRFRGKRLRS